MNKYALTMQIIRSVRDKTDTAVLFYSAGGKDGIALLDMLAGVFDKVYVPHTKFRPCAALYQMGRKSLQKCRSTQN